MTAAMTLSAQRRPSTTPLESYVADPRATRPRRRRPALSVALAGLAIIVLCLAPRVGSAFGSVPASAPERGPEPVVYVVQPGDTLWSIARQVQPTGDVRPLVERLERANHGNRLQVGDRLTLNG
jgi:nucleoid-associated protein YgaU